jgi:hypothetical protein
MKLQMLLHEIKLSGYRSVAPTATVLLTSLGQVNLLIGPNNVGKSNIGRFLVRVRDLLSSYRQIKPWGEGVSWRAPFRIEFSPADEVDHWLRESHPIEAEITLRAEVLKSPTPLSNILLTQGTVRVRITMTRAGVNGVLSVVPLSAAGKPVIIEDEGTTKLLCADGSYVESVTAAHTHRLLAVAICQCLSTSILEIRPLRDPSRNSANQKQGSTDGGEIIEALRKYQGNVNQQAFWTKCKRDIRKWLQILLGEKEVSIEINDAGFWVELRRGEVEFRCSLQDLGTGVSEVLMVLSYLRLHPDSDYLVVFDEPEAHLHPGAVVELSRIITTGLPNHQLLITTHSTALVDAVTPAWRTFRVSRNPAGSTAVEPLDMAIARLGLLSDLGVRPSQLFLARVAIWVEGPSDVYYLTALFQQAAPALVAGRDFAFVTYGGASASHVRFGFGAEEDEDDVEVLVEVLSVSHRAVIVCDRDRAVGEVDRDLVKVLARAAARRGDHARVEHPVGKEMENAVRPEVLKLVLAEVRPKRLGTGNSLVRLLYEDYEINLSDEFNRVVAAAARTEKGEMLTKAQCDRVRELLDARKCRIAQRVRELSCTQSVFREEAVERAKALEAWIAADPTPAR